MGKSLILIYLRWTPQIVFVFFLFSFLLILPLTIHSLDFFLTHSLSLLWDLLLYSLIGLSFSMLASLAAWPLALTFSTLLLQKKSFPIFKIIQRVAYILSGIPLLFYSFVIIEVLDHLNFFGLKSLSIEVLSTSNLLTQSIAFAFTILLYPFCLILGFYQNLNVEQFYQVMIGGVIQFAELGFVSFVIILTCFLYILPKMIVKMFFYLQKNENIKNYEVVQALGGTQWESLYLASLQGMKLNFNAFIVQFTKICFFEGILTYSLIHYYLKNYGNSWGETLSSFFIHEAMTTVNPQKTIAIGGFLFFVYALFVVIENYFLKIDKDENG